MPAVMDRSVVHVLYRQSHDGSELWKIFRVSPDSAEVVTQWGTTITSRTTMAVDEARGLYRSLITHPQPWERW